MTTRWLDRVFPFWRAALGGIIPHPIGCECPRVLWHWVIQVSPETFDVLVEHDLVLTEA